MNTLDHCSNRRSFLKMLTAAGAGMAVGDLLPGKAQTPTKLRLGMDNFAVRAMGWKADALIDYAVSLKLDVLFITDLDAFENFEDNYLKGLRAKANAGSLQLYLDPGESFGEPGKTRALCPCHQHARFGHLGI